MADAGRRVETIGQKGIGGTHFQAGFGHATVAWTVFIPALRQLKPVREKEYSAVNVPEPETRMDHDSDRRPVHGFGARRPVLYRDEGWAAIWEHWVGAQCFRRRLYPGTQPGIERVPRG